MGLPCPRQQRSVPSQWQWRARSHPDRPCSAPEYNGQPYPGRCCAALTMRVQGRFETHACWVRDHPYVPPRPPCTGGVVSPNLPLTRRRPCHCATQHIYCAMQNRCGCLTNADNDERDVVVAAAFERHGDEIVSGLVDINCC